MQHLVAPHQPWPITALASEEATPVFLGVSVWGLGSYPSAQTERCDHSHSLSRRNVCPTFAGPNITKPRTASVQCPPRHTHSRSEVLSTD